MTSKTFNGGVLKFCAWMGPAFVLMWVVGAAPLAHFIYVPPPSAADSAAHTVHNYVTHLTGVRIGCAVMIFASALYGFWGMAATMYTRPAEGHRPILFYCQIICLACCVVVIMFIGFFWGVAAFRPGQTSPDVTQALNDLGWFGVLFTGAPFTGWAWAMGAAIFLDKSETRYFPRWLAYFNFWAGLMYIEACLILFFKHGPFSQDGFAVFYVPVAFFFIWIITLAFLTMRAVDKEKAMLAEADAQAGAATGAAAQNRPATAVSA